MPRRDDTKVEEPKKAPAKVNTQKTGEKTVVKENPLSEQIKKLIKDFKMEDKVVDMQEKRLKIQGVTKNCCFVEFKEPKENIGEFLYGFFLEDMFSHSYLMMEILPPTDDDGALLALYELEKDEVS